MVTGVTFKQSWSLEMYRIKIWWIVQVCAFISIILWWIATEQIELVFGSGATFSQGYNVRSVCIPQNKSTYPVTV